MKYEIISIILIVSVFAINEKDQRIVENTRTHNENPYNFRYSTTDEQETGRFEKVGENLIFRMNGSHQYISSDGNRFEVVYETDERGYKPSIDPKPSPRSSTINERRKEQDLQMTENPPTDKSVVVGQHTSLRPVFFNQTENMELLNISYPQPEIVLDIGSAAIASLAGGGLG